MSNQNSKGFSSSWAFILAAAGSAVGLGNIWKFPYITGENGGGAFVIFYLLCIAALGIPVMLSEIFIGRRGKAGPVDSFHEIAKSVEGGENTKKFSWYGYVAMITAFIILSFYGVVGGWAIYYTQIALGNGFAGIAPPEAGAIFGGLLASSGTLITYQLIFMAVAIFIVARGISGGIETATTFLMPIFFVMLVGLTGYALLTTGSGGDALSFMFSPDFSKLTPAAMVEALGHAFFSLSLGMAAMLVYGQYLPKGAPVIKTVLTVVVVDTLVALSAGLMIFSIIFSQGGEASGGPGLLFVALPVAFGEMSGGYFFGILWFGLIIVAALTSGISMLEVCTAHFVKRGFNRMKVALTLGVTITLTGFGSVWSFGPGEHVAIFAGKNLFDTLDFITSNVFLPLGGLMVVLVAGWTVPRQVYRDFIPSLSDSVFGAVYFITRYIAPVLVTALLIYMIVSGL